MTVPPASDPFSAVLGDGRGGESSRDETLHVLATNGRTFVFRVLRRGDRYGARRCLVHEDDAPQVEVFDATDGQGSRHWDPLGQFTTGRYWVSTLLEGADEPRALCLHGGVPEWTVDAVSMVLVLDWLAIACPHARPGAPEAPAEPTTTDFVVSFDRMHEACNWVCGCHVAARNDELLSQEEWLRRMRATRAERDAVDLDDLRGIKAQFERFRQQFDDFGREYDRMRAARSS